MIITTLKWLINIEGSLKADVTNAVKSLEKNGPIERKELQTLVLERLHPNVADEKNYWTQAKKEFIKSTVREFTAKKSAVKIIEQVIWNDPLNNDDLSKYIRRAISKRKIDITKVEIDSTKAEDPKITVEFDLSKKVSKKIIKLFKNKIKSLEANTNQLNNTLDNHLKVAQRCDAFFTQYSKPTQISPSELKKVQEQYSSNFSKMYRRISGNSHKTWEKQYQKICISSAFSEELEEKLKLCKTATKAFQKNLLLLIQNNASALLTKEGDKGRVFFLPELHPPLYGNSKPKKGGIGECHCYENVARKGRNQFSHHLVSEIAKYFPKEKQVHIASIGAGTCFHELEIHSLAQAAGYSISQWTLVEPNLCPQTAENFKTLARWSSPHTVIKCDLVKADSYFSNLENDENKPDVFLFIDMDRFITESDMENFAEKLSHPGLYVYFSKGGTRTLRISNTQGVNL